MQKHPAISVIMSVKNGANSLSRCIDSIINQTFKDWELIICDDGSTDETYSVLQAYRSLDSRIRIFKNETSKGLAYSLNCCIQKARSNILARQDADDYSDLNRFDIQYKFITQKPQYAIVGTCWYNVVNEQKYKQSVPKEPTAKEQIKGGLYMHPSWMMRKDMIESVGLYTANKYTIRSQDYHLVMKVLGAGMKIYNMQEYLYYYVVDDSTINRSINWKRVKGLMWIRYDAYRRNKLPLWAYIYVLKPLFSNLLPKGFMKRYYRSVYKNQ